MPAPHRTGKMPVPHGQATVIPTRASPICCSEGAGTSRWPAAEVSGPLFSSTFPDRSSSFLEVGQALLPVSWPSAMPSPAQAGVPVLLACWAQFLRRLSSSLILRSMERSRVSSRRSISFHSSPEGARQASRSIAAFSSSTSTSCWNASSTAALSSSNRRSSSW